MHALTRRCCSPIGSRSPAIPLIAARQWIGCSSSTGARKLLPSTSVRHEHNTASQSPGASAASRTLGARAIVIGGGPAGIAVVGALLDHIPRGKIAWIDRSFDGGSMGRLYREVPSYSEVGDFLLYARTLGSFLNVSKAVPQPNAITALEGLDPEMTCSLNYAADMLQLLSDGLFQHARVAALTGKAIKVIRNRKTEKWNVIVERDEIGRDPTRLKVQSPIVIYCTGSHPKTSKLPVNVPRLTLETGLAPSRLAKVLPTEEPCTVAVQGDGHSAVLTLRNLFHLAAMSHRRLRIRWLTRTAYLRYAEETDDGVIRNENTGLMGEASRFARSQLEGDRLATSDAGAFITRVLLPPVPENKQDAAAQQQQRDDEERALLAQHLEGVDYIIQAIGFTRTQPPEVRPDLAPLRAPPGAANKLVFNGVTGSFFPHGAPRDTVIGLFGAGSAFPQLEFTSEGWRQPAVGIWKFMKFVQRMVPMWWDATKRGTFQEEQDNWRTRVERRWKAQRRAEQNAQRRRRESGGGGESGEIEAVEVKRV